jgi:hypothetical protein
MLKLQFGQSWEGICCEEIMIKRLEKISLSGIIVCLSLAKDALDQPPDTVIIYFQGNTGSPLHCVPLFQTLLHLNRFHHSNTHIDSERLAIMAVVPHLYWKSTQCSPTQKGILKDYLQVLTYTLS